MNIRVLLIIIGVVLHPVVSLWAQQDAVRLQEVSVAEALATINERYPDNSIHFVRNELDTVRVGSVIVKGQDLLDDLTRLVAPYPIRLKIFGNHIFVEYKRQKPAWGNLPLALNTTDEEVAFSRMLHEVTVLQSLPSLDMNGSTMTLRIADTPLAVAGSAYDLLGYLPGIQLGVPGTVIRIDGKTVTSYSELTELDSEDIERIDYSDQPLFCTRQGVVIDIRTHRTREDGYGIQTASQYSQGERGRAMQQVKSNLHRDRWDLQASGTYRYEGIDKDLTVNQCKFQDRYEQNTFHLNLASEYQLSKQLTVGLQYQLLTLLNPVRQSRDNLLFVFDEKNMMWESNMSNMQSICHWQLDYQPQHDLNVFAKSSWGQWDANVAMSLYHDGVELSEANAIQTVIEHRSNEVRNTLWAVKADLQRPIGRGRLQLRAEYSHTERDDRYHRPDSLLQNSCLRRQNRVSGSVAYHQPLGQGEGTVGLLVEDIDTYSDFQKVFPFVHYGIGRGTKLSLSYALRSSMPTYGQTNGFAYHNIERLGVEGEPNLCPSLSHHVQLKAQWGGFFGVVGWQRVKDYIGQSIESKNEEFVVSYHNLDVANLYSATLHYRHSLRSWTSQYTVSLMGQQLTDNGRRFDEPIVGLQWNNQIQLPFSLTALLTASYQTSGHEGISWRRQTGQLGCSLVKESKNWTLQLKADDLLRTGFEHTVYYGKDSEYSRRCYADNQRVQLTLRIHLGSLSRHSLQTLQAGASERKRLF